jgi:hypothetical protein
MGCAGYMNLPVATRKTYTEGKVKLSLCLVPIGKEVGWTSEPVLTPPGLELQPLGRPASSYTDYAIPAPTYMEI